MLLQPLMTAARMLLLSVGFQLEEDKMLSRNLKVIFFSAALFLCAIGQSGASPVLYASTGGPNSAGGGRIYVIDPIAATVMLVGNTGLGRVGGLALAPNGTLYAASGGSGNPGTLYTVNRATGAATLVGPISGIPAVGALAFSAGGTLYGGGWNGSIPPSGSGRLVTIDPATGAVLTDVDQSGSGNAFTPGLAFSPTGELFGSRGGSTGHTEDLVIIDVATGVQTPIGSATQPITDIWFGSIGDLYAVSSDGDVLTIDPTTGTQTLLFDTALNFSGLTGFEPTAVPEPGSFGLLGVALAALGIMRRRKKA